MGLPFALNIREVTPMREAMGVERLLMVLESQNVEIPSGKPCDIYIAPMGNAAAIKATALCTALRRDGFEAQCDVCGRGLKAQMKYANKIGAKFTLVLGDSEIESGKAKLKDMAEGTETEIKIDEVVEELGEAIRMQIFKNIAEIIIAKNREGSTGTVELAWLGQYTKFAHIL